MPGFVTGGDILMNELLKNNISWGELESVEHGDFRCEITDAYFLEGAGRISITIRLNFVVPAQDDAKIKQALLEHIHGIKDVVIKYEYEKDMAFSARDAAVFYVRRMLVVDDPRIARMIYGGTIDVDDTDGTITVNSIGRMLTEKLNRTTAKRLAEGLRSDLGLDYSVVFVNHEETYAKTEQNIECADIIDEPEDEYEAPDYSGIPVPEYDPSMFAAEEAAYNMPSGSEPVMGFMTSAPANKAASGIAAGKPKNASAGRKTAAKEAAPADKKSVRIMGRRIAGKPVPLNTLSADSGKVVVEGFVLGVEEQVLRTGTTAEEIIITDKRSTTCLIFYRKDADVLKKINEQFKKGDYIRAAGETEYSSYKKSVMVKIRSLEKLEAPKREDTCKLGKRVELHCHTKMSEMDGLNEPSVIVNTACEWGQPAVAITDHGVVQSFPDAAGAAAKLAKKGKNIKIIYGVEGYYIDDRNVTAEDGTIDYKSPKSYHIILLAATQEGLKNIYKLVSISHLDYFHKRPRMPRSVIEAHREGIIIGSACEMGEVYQAIEQGFDDETVKGIASFYDYLEIQPLVNNKFLLKKGVFSDLEQLKDNNRRIVRIADELGKPVVATTDAHYDEPESAIFRTVLQAGRGFKDAEDGDGLYLRTTDEMLDEFSYLGDKDAKRVVIDNTNLIADMISGDIKPVPDDRCPPDIEGAAETLRKTCYEKAHSIYGDPLPPEIEERLKKELDSIIGHGYAVMYVAAQLLVNKSLEDGYLVGSRGSVGSSFAATMAGITEVNPLDPHYVCPKCKKVIWGDKQVYDCGVDMPPIDCPDCGTPMKRDGFTIPFATFLGFKGDKEPDIDLNFAGEYQARAHKYVGVIFGEENVFKAGTVGTVEEKTARGYVWHYFEETGRAMNPYEMDRLTNGCTGVRRTTGQHPGGIIIVPRDHEIYEFCPVQHPANDTKTDIVTTHFDYHKIDKNLLKLDILGHNVPSMIRHLQDMTGVNPLTIDLTDQKVLSIFNGTEALDIKDKDYPFTHGSYAIPEFGTPFVRGMLDDVKPSRFEDLIRMSGFSHGTDVWLNNAQDYIRSGVATMREVISTRDDIMNFCILKGIENVAAFRIMENVRKKDRILTEEDIAVMKEHNIPDWYIDSCGKIKYMFPRAHAVAYVMMSFRMAYYKVYYPAPFYAAYFTSVLTDFSADDIMGGPFILKERMDYLNSKGNDMTDKEKKELIVLEVAYEMYARGYKFEHARFGESDAIRFTVKDGNVLLPIAAYQGVGENAAKAMVDAWNEKPFETVEDCQMRSRVGNNVIKTLNSHGVFGELPETSQIAWTF